MLGTVRRLGLTYKVSFNSTLTGLQRYTSPRIVDHSLGWACFVAGAGVCLLEPTFRLQPDSEQPEGCCRAEAGGRALLS